MGRKHKVYDNDLDAIKRLFFRNYNQELKGQSKFKHYHATKELQTYCTICNKTNCKLHRHRVIPGGVYEDSNIVVCCAKCHKRIHAIYNATDASNELSYRLAIMIVKTELD